MKIITYFRKDWAIIPVGVIMGAGYLWSIIDFIFLQKLVFQPLWILIGVVLFVLGSIIEGKVRIELIKKAGFPGVMPTIKLQVVKGHRLITDGIFRYVRHPLYSGRILLSFGWVLILSSFYGALLMVIGAMFFLPRIRIEEDMLLKEFGDAYRDYQKTTKKLIPYFY